MFDSVLGRAGGQRTQFGKAAVISAAIHAAIPVALIWFAAKHQEAPKDDKVIVFVPPGAGPRRGPAVETVAPAKPASHPKHKKRAVVQPLHPDVPPPVAAVEPPPEAAATSEVDAADDASDDSTGPAGPEVIGSKVAGSGDGPGTGTGSGEIDVYNPTRMTQPRMLEGDPIEYPRAAVQAHVEGLTVVQCVITTEGLLQQCRTIKPLPYMEEAVMRSLHSRKYTPVLVDGVPTSVKYVFAIKMVLPH